MVPWGEPNLLVISTYSKLVPTANYHEMYQQHNWLAVICDESHCLKNDFTILVQKLAELKRVVSVMLSGK